MTNLESTLINLQIVENNHNVEDNVFLSKLNNTFVLNCGHYDNSFLATMGNHILCIYSNV